MTGKEKLLALGFEEETQLHLGEAIFISLDSPQYKQITAFRLDDWGIIVFDSEEKTYHIRTGYETSTSDITIEMTEAFLQYLKEII